MRHHLVRRAGAIVLACVIVLTACGDEDDQTLDATSTTSTAVADDTEPVDEGAGGTAPEITTTETIVADGTVIEVGVTDGAVTGGGRHRVDLGETVTIRVTSDVADHVHLHGYDVVADVGARETAELTFDATIPGVFEVELEDTRIPLLDLEVS
ncbi:MAG: hypothetical protein ACSLFO_07420 [Acidimicrobiales bacterium]